MSDRNDHYGYDVFEDTDTGEKYAIQRSTGELYPVVTVDVVAGSMIYTPEDQEWHRRRKEWESKEKYYRVAKNFVFVSCSTDYPEIGPANMTRLIYLSTYLNYHGLLMLSERTPMKRKDFERVLHLSQTSVYGFWNAVRDKFIIEQPDGTLLINGSQIFRGKIQSTGRFLKFFTSPVQKLYKQMSARQHKMLGVLFMMLPFVNLEYNAFSWNPEETILDSVDYMTWKQFCELTVISIRQMYRMKQELEGLMFPVAPGRCESVFTFVNQGTDVQDSLIFINPNIMYSGHHPERVTALAEFC